MAKSRADGTPAKPGRKASPAKATKASPAKTAKSKTATPERTTRSSPRRTVPSAKAQEAAVDHVQTGRVAKKASPKKNVKATTPAKETSPAKATKRTMPVKKTVPAKKLPGKSTTPTTAKKATSSFLIREDSAGHMYQAFQRYVTKSGIIELLETADTFDLASIAYCYTMLHRYRAVLDGNARATDDEETRQLRPVYRKVKKNMRGLLGPGLDECLKNNTDMELFFGAFRTGLQNGGLIDPNGPVNHDLQIPRESMPAIHFTAQDLERANENWARAGESLQKMNVEFEASGLTRLEFIKRLTAADKVAAGRVIKPASRAASRSRSPAKSPTKREREASVSRPVRARSQTPIKAATRTASKSPAPVGRPSTRSRSPAEVADDAGRKSRSKSPAKAPTRKASKSPAPMETSKTRSKSPAKVRQSSPAPLEVAKTRSKSPAKKDHLYRPSAFDFEEDEPGECRHKYIPVEINPLTFPPEPPTKKSTKTPAKRTASPSTKAPSPSKRVRSASPAKAPKPPTSTKARARSTSPIKKSSPRSKPRLRTSLNWDNPPHPNERGRGGITSPTNPPTLATLANKPNPFHTTLPAPEIWHRRMPPYFPFGETPFMEREISRQIEEDLERGK